MAPGNDERRHADAARYGVSTGHEGNSAGALESAARVRGAPLTRGALEWVMAGQGTSPAGNGPH